MFQVTILVFFCALLHSGLTSGGYEIPFGCEGKAISDRTRLDALDFINFIRARTALGQYGEFNISSSNDMNKLKWDCNLEVLAGTAVKDCPENSQPIENAINFNFFGSTTPEEMLRNSIATAMWTWTAIRNVTWPVTNIYNGNPALHHFANAMYANATAVGCYSDTCGFTASAACVFSQPEVQDGKLVYTTGTPCPNGAQCANSKPGVCESGLCVLNGTLSTTKLPTTTTGRPPTSMTTNLPNRTTTKPPTTTTGRPPTRTTTTPRKRIYCPNKAFNVDFRDTALGLHNNFRSLVARGLARNAEYVNENAPPASRMDLLDYDCNAERFAYHHVCTCDRKLSSPFSRPGYEENIHILRTTATDVLGALQNAIATWNSELTSNGIPSNMILTPQVFNRRQRTVTKVTKIIWGKNRYVGCATRRCHGFYFTSCMYRKPVNVIGQNIYSIGQPCSGCPLGPNSCNPAIGLCSY